ncbi:MAG: hypothetical protein E6Q97_22800 [Desulfurellales bacterium]|nr:MAG: hypothetical protein E6Q97_22800 [Desulfurellales bacterium]
MANEKKPRIQSRNFLTDLATVAVGLIGGALTYFNASVDGEAASQIAGAMPEVIGTARQGAWGLFIVAFIKLVNIGWHVFKG